MWRAYGTLCLLLPHTTFLELLFIKGESPLIRPPPCLTVFCQTFFYFSSPSLLIHSSGSFPPFSPPPAFPRGFLLMMFTEQR